MLLSKQPPAGTLTEAAIDRDSSGQYLLASCQIWAWPKCKVFGELPGGLFGQLRPSLSKADANAKHLFAYWGQIAIIQFAKVCSWMHEIGVFRGKSVAMSAPKRGRGVILGWYNLAAPQFTSELGGWPNLSQSASVVRTTLTDAATLELLAESFIGIWFETHIHTQTQKKKCPWRGATGCLLKNFSDAAAVLHKANINTKH